MARCSRCNKFMLIYPTNGLCKDCDASIKREEETRRRAEENRKRQEEEETRRKTEAERKRHEEETRRKAEEERKQQEKEARRMAEEERKIQEAEILRRIKEEQKQQDVITDRTGKLNYRILQDGTLEIVKLNCRSEWTSWICHIPERIDGKAVTKIGKNAFENCNIMEVWIPNSLKSIEGNPFVGNEIYRIHVNDDNPYFAVIDNVLFSKPDKRLITFPCGARTKDYEIPNGIQIIDEDAFTNMGFGSSITFPNTVDKILSNPAEGFFIETILTPGNKQLKIINNCLIRVADGKLITGRPSNIPAEKPSYNPTQQEKPALLCHIPDCVKVIGKKAFRGSGSDCTSISIPQSVIMIEDEAFMDCFNLQTITIPNSVISIGRGAFHGCTKLKSITLPNTINVIRSETFKKCNELVSIVLPNGVVAIGKEAFCDCSKLTDVTIPKSVKHMDNNVFDYTHQLTVHVKKGSYAHKYCEKRRIKFDYPGYSEPDKLAWLNA